MAPLAAAEGRSATGQRHRWARLWAAAAALSVDGQADAATPVARRRVVEGHHPLASIAAGRGCGQWLPFFGRDVPPPESHCLPLRATVIC